ncbi:MAG TPA: CHAD domain-containing protein, partial [Candidatus Methylomirabilis sp.]|nr:CHAD domain-containing protein [Candidatus Methylomirabilis sp.]
PEKVRYDLSPTVEADEAITGRERVAEWVKEGQPLIPFLFLVLQKCQRFASMADALERRCNGLEAEVQSVRVQHESLQRERRQNLTAALSRKGLGLDPAGSMGEAARLILSAQLDRMLAHERGSREGRDQEELHDMRVAVRRMRAALRLFGPFLDRTAYKPFRKPLRRTGRVLGRVRDLDVFRHRAEQYLDTLPQERRSELDQLLAAWQTAYDAAREEMLTLLDSEAYLQFKEEFARFLATPGAGAPQTPPEDASPLPNRVREAVALLIAGSSAAVRAFQGRVERREASLPRLHRLRITAKGLRYALEFFRELLPADAESLIDRIKELQDHLGGIQDAVVTCGILLTFLASGAWGDDQTKAPATQHVVLDPGVTAYLSVQQAELQRLVREFPLVWTKVSGEDFRRQLFTELAAL